MFHPQGPTFRELAVQALSSTERGYDLLAPKFEYTPFRTPDGILETAMAHIGDPRSIGAALDICCGTGAAMRHLRLLCRDRVVGLDFSLGMLQVARRLTADAPGDAAVEFVRADVLTMPLAAAFDVAVCFGAFGHILPRDEARFVDRVRGVLRPGGRFVFATCSKPPVWSTSYVLSQGFNAAMHVRNLFVRPPFIMYYLTFLLPRAQSLLEERGFEVEVHEGVFVKPWQRLVLVVATRQE